MYNFSVIEQKTNGHCFYCGSIKNLEVDHFVSRKKWFELGLEAHIGSCNKLENIFLACRSCNSKKRAKDPEDFIGNPYSAWSRYSRANRRAGIDDGGSEENMFGFGGITPMWLEKNIDKVINFMPNG